MNTTAANTRIDTNGHPPEFNPHEAPHFAPELGYGPPPGFVAHQPGNPPGALNEQRRLNQTTPVNPTGRPNRKRKTPPSQSHDPAFDPSGDFTPGVLDPLTTGEHPPGDADGDPSQMPMSHMNKPLNPGKRAEQNRKAQRAFRERREVHMKELEARSNLLDAALSSADEANRRWEECRAIVDQLRNENTQLRTEVASLRAALGNAAAAFQAQAIPNGVEPPDERSHLAVNVATNERGSKSPGGGSPRQEAEK